MRFYNQQHKFYCGIDLHARKMYFCILDQMGKTKVHEKIKADPEALFDLIFPFMDCHCNTWIKPKHCNGDNEKDGAVNY